MKADFTAHLTPVLAVPCPTCAAGPGTWCKRPSGHKASRLHHARASSADDEFILQHGENASIDTINGRWIIDPQGRASRTVSA